MPLPFTLVQVEGLVDLARGTGVLPAQPPDLLDQDDRVVSRDGRAALAGADGTLLFLNRASELRIDAAQRPRLVRGRLVARTPRDAELTAVATPVGVADLDPDGDYELAAADLDGDTVVTVRRGRAVLRLVDQDVVIAAGDAVRVDPREPRPRWSRAAEADGFVSWARSVGATSEKFAAGAALPAPLAPFAGALDSHGTWTTVAPYGPVWFPSAGAAWRPYSQGTWRHTRYGWTWIDSEAWAWPLHHYGRWGHDPRGWYWIPQRTWGPAWVAWALDADHVAWAPLGWNARPVVDFFAGRQSGGVDAWARAWSVMPRGRFGRREPVTAHLQDPRTLPGPVLGGFVSQLIGPRGPADPDDRFAARPAWPERAPASFGSAAAGRLVAPRAEERVTPSAGPMTIRGTRQGGRRPGDAPAMDDASAATRQVAPPAPAAASPRAHAPDSDPGAQDRDVPAAQRRGANAIRPRYEPPSATPSSGSASPGAPPSGAPSSAAPPSSGAPTPRTRPRANAPEPRAAGAGQAAGTTGGRRRPG